MSSSKKVALKESQLKPENREEEDSNQFNIISCFF